MKRGFAEGDVETNLALANCLMMLSQGGSGPYEADMNGSGRLFECKTCNRQFTSFQALGGHRASHKKPRLTEGDGGVENQTAAKPKTHECSICGLEFAIGQALGGHMRRHRAGLSENQALPKEQQQVLAPIVKKSNSSRIVLCLDLNLTPLENDLQFLKLGIGKPAIDCLL
ncbi:hypothetical protein SLE2022_109140 [Rubroshorea leprosula]